MTDNTIVRLGRDDGVAHPTGTHAPEAIEHQRPCQATTTVIRMCPQWVNLGHLISTINPDQTGRHLLAFRRNNHQIPIKGLVRRGTLASEPRFVEVSLPDGIFQRDATGMVAILLQCRNAKAGWQNRLGIWLVQIIYPNIFYSAQVLIPSLCQPGLPLSIVIVGQRLAQRARFISGPVLLGPIQHARF